MRRARPFGKGSGLAYTPGATVLWKSPAAAGIID